MNLTKSIDNYIDSHRGNDEIELCAKLAIVRSILSAEKKSKLFLDPQSGNRSPNFKRLHDTWYSSFMQLLTEGCRANQLEERLSLIAMIIFNYDRCIEHFLYHSLQTFYGISEKEAARLLGCIQIYHPYGTVGLLPWQSGDTVEFGYEPGASKLLSLAPQIKTFTEGTDPTSSEVASIRQKVMEAPIILFLGFGFHNINLDLIRPPTLEVERVTRYKLFATAFGMSSSNCEIITRQLHELCGRARRPTKPQVRHDLTCHQLFKEYSKSLSLW
jgi:hypothetical protein